MLFYEVGVYGHSDHSTILCYTAIKFRLSENEGDLLSLGYVMLSYDNLDLEDYFENENIKISFF